MSSSTRSRAIRFLGITVVTAALGQLLIFTFFAILGWPALLANATAVLIVAVVGFFLSLRFVWVDADPNDRALQISVFLGMSVLGLLVSSAAVHLVTLRIDHVLAANLGSFLGYGIAWLVRFFVLDRVIFVPRTSQP